MLKLALSSSQALVVSMTSLVPGFYIFLSSLFLCLFESFEGLCMNCIIMVLFENMFDKRKLGERVIFSLKALKG